MSTSVDARIMDYNGLVELESTAVDSDALGVGTFALSDNRDDKDYLVRRLADGNCWMVQNLDLELADFAGTQKLTPANTDINTEGKIYWDPSESVTLGEKTIEDGSQFASSSAQGGRWVSKYNENVENGIYLGTGDLLDPNNLDGSSMPSNRSWLDLQQTSRNNTAYYNTDHLWVEENRNSQAPRSISNGLAWLDNSDPTVITVETTYNVEDDGEPSSSSWYKGSWYNWYAATAESGTFETSNSSASDSICSKNWMLPTTYDSLARKSLQNLLSSYSISRSNNATLKENPIAMVTSGEYSLYYGTFFLTGVHMSFWTSKASSNTNSIAFSNYSNVLNIDENGRKNRGFSIRCVNKGSNQETVTPTTCSNGQICYNGNGADSGSTASQTASSSDTTILTAPGYTRDGYAFAGWSTSPNGYGTIYGPNESIDATGLYTTVDDTTTATSSLQLYAKWIKSSGTMQDFTATQCSDMKEHEVIALTDNRDGNTYSVAKLKDGNCWMTSNLALNLADFAGTQKLTSDNTDLNSSEAITRGYWDPGESTKEKWTTTYAAELDARNLTRDFTGLSTLLLGQAQPNQFQTSDDAQPTGWWWGSKVSDDGTYTLQSSFINFSPNAAIPRSYISPTTKSYNRYAAFAESYPDHNSSDTVCPSGWRIPTYNSQDMRSVFSLYANDISDGSNELAQVLRGSVLQYSLEGYYTNIGTINYPGGLAEYHIQTSDGTVRQLRLYSGSAYINYAHIPDEGMAIRCLLK